MTKDLEETLSEMGPEYREVANRVIAAYRPSPRVFADVASVTAVRPGRIARWVPAYLIAASLVVFLGVGVLFRGNRAASSGRVCETYVVAYGGRSADISRIVSTQLEDGSWGSDYLTRQNAAALREAGGDAEMIAYKKAVRYLRMKGLKPLSQDEFKTRSDAASRYIANT